MKRASIYLVIAVGLILIALPALAGRTVYITKTGEKYHLGSCRYLKKSKIPVDIEEAVRRGYTPCSVCKPGWPEKKKEEPKEEEKKEEPEFIEIELVEVIDGDTIKAIIDDTEEKIRYIGIDSPEMNSNNDEDPEPWAEEATEFNEKLLEDRELFIELDVQERDRYGRILAYVYAKDEGEELMANEVLLRWGYAKLMTVPPNVKYVDRFKEEQKKAKDDEAGMWGD